MIDVNVNSQNLEVDRPADEIRFLSSINYAYLGLGKIAPPGSQALYTSTHYRIRDVKSLVVVCQEVEVVSCPVDYKEARKIAAGESTYLAFRNHAIKLNDRKPNIFLFDFDPQ